MQTTAGRTGATSIAQEVLVLAENMNKQQGERQKDGIVANQSKKRKQRSNDEKATREVNEERHREITEQMEID